LWRWHGLPFLKESKVEQIDPIHRALCLVANCSLDGALIEQAESLVSFLEPRVPNSRELALISIWLLSQRGHLHDAQRLCERHLTQFAQAEELQAMLAVLRYYNNDPDWRPACEQVLMSSTQTDELRQMAAALLDDRFDPDTFGEAPPGATPPCQAEAFDPSANPALLGAYTRA
jgi:Bacterial type III secretion protein (HrpB1_HrpK)